ncbi:MAG: hypothetical protein U0136_06150 [Bdellovibrionota bacterium]
MDVSASQTSSSASTATSEKEFDSWYDKAKAKVMNLNLSDDDLIKYVSKELSSADSSPQKRNALQQLMNLRSQAAESISNTLRLILEISRTVIANIRP